MADEDVQALREALGRIRAFEDWASNHYEPPTANPYAGLQAGTDAEDRHEVINAYLDEHPDDEDEPVTEEWLRSVGFAPGCLSGENPGFGYRYSPIKQIEIHVMSAVGKLSNALVATRGDVRRLCKALGVKVDA